MSFCSNCGKEIREEANFCSNCGQEVISLDENISEAQKYIIEKEEVGLSPVQDFKDSEPTIVNDSGSGVLSEREEAFKDLSTSRPASEFKGSLGTKKKNYFWIAAFIGVMLLVFLSAFGASTLTRQREMQDSFDRAERSFNQRKYVRAESELKDFLTQYPKSKQAEEAARLLAVASEEADAIREQQKEAAEKQRVENEKEAAKKKAAEEKEAKKAEKELEEALAQFDYYDEDFGVVFDSGENSGYGMVTLRGRVVPFRKDYSYVQISFGIYSLDGESKIGTAYANTNHLDRGTTWQYRAIGTADTDANDRFQYRLEDITGW